MKSWCFAFLACGIVALSGCATNEEFNAGEAAKTREAIPGEVNPNAPEASQQQVRTQPGFREAYRRYVEGGWMGLACDPAARAFNALG